MKNVIRSIVAVAVLAAAGAAHAQVGGLPHTHDGFFLQLDLGLGGTRSEVEDAFGEIAYSGVSGQFSIGIGGALSPNFILAGQLWGVSITDPRMEADGEWIGDLEGGDFSMSGIGVQLVYYFPTNVYLSATPSLTRLRIDDGFDEYETEFGFGVRFAVGKEWWVSDNWGIGINGQLALSSNAHDGGGDSPTWGTAWFGVGFSATYN